MLHFGEQSHLDAGILSAGGRARRRTHPIRVDAGASGLDIGYNSISKSDGKAPVGSPYPNDLWMVSPQFVSIANRDFHLQSTSPLIDTGTTMSTVTNDMDSVLRPLGINYDVAPPRNSN